MLNINPAVTKISVMAMIDYFTFNLNVKPFQLHSMKYPIYKLKQLPKYCKNSKLSAISLKQDIQMHALLPRKHITEKDNFSYLLFSLFFMLLSSSVVDQFFARSLLGQSLVIAFTVISMAIGVWSLRSNRYAFNTAVGLVATTVIISTLVIALDKAELSFIHLIIMLYFFVITLKLAAQQVLFSNQITANNIIGSICIFLLLGLIWVMLYLLLAEFIPNSFSGLESSTWQENFPNFIYFSFVTLTTLGFGDLLPTSPLARFLVYIEAIIGVFYMAIVVSSLVSAGISDIQARKK
jgi:hypothetical protein